MKIRSITYFLNPSYPFNPLRLQGAADFLQIARPAFGNAGYEVQSARLATVPFPLLVPEATPGGLACLAAELQASATKIGYAYLSLGPAIPAVPGSYDCIPAALEGTNTSFFAGLVTTADGAVSLPAIRQCARVIQQASRVSADGFANLRFAVLANVPPGSPFFPAAYHQGGEPAFALAAEAADLALTAFKQAGSLEEGRKKLVQAMEAHGRALAEAATRVEEHTGARFGGIDFSLAPFPDDDSSIGAALEQLGVPALGMHGSLAAAAILADTMDQARFQRAGFSGLMLPVLEDSFLARRAAEGRLTVKDLLLYSSVCGTGLDTVPLPGDTSEEQLAAVLLDLASLSLRLSKPLTARLMPIPGKNAGDMTGFDFAYFANSRVLPIDANPLQGFMRGDELISLHRRDTR